MENVKGLLSATVRDDPMFERIVGDLRSPAEALRREGRPFSIRGTLPRSPRYEIFPVTCAGPEERTSADFIVQMERFGIPQARHRVILLGVRADVLGSARAGHLRPQPEIPASKVLSGLPRLRSGLSREADDASTWVQRVQSASQSSWYRAEMLQPKAVFVEIQKALARVGEPPFDRGAEFIPSAPSAPYRSDWYLDERIGGVYNHTTRTHIVGDLHRYLYCAAFARAVGRSPVLADFPEALLPLHRNVRASIGGGNFEDRFRVQTYDRPSTTITSHIGKDGHYYIHPDPSQCRSLTLREAARLQTFPDNYFFCGPRTAQYQQVGNAVPPLLAAQIGRIVLQLLRDTGLLA